MQAISSMTFCDSELCGCSSARLLGVVLTYIIICLSYVSNKRNQYDSSVFFLQLRGIIVTILFPYPSLPFPLLN